MRFLKKSMMCSGIVLSMGAIFISSVYTLGSERFSEILSRGVSSSADVFALFPKTTDEVDQRVNEAIAEANAGIQRVLDIAPRDRTFANTVRALDRVENRFKVVFRVLYVYGLVAPTEVMRTACNDALVQLQNYSVDAFMNKDLYCAFRAYEEHGDKNESLLSEERYAFQEIMRFFHREGFDLPAKQFERVKELNKEISRLSLKFNSAIDADTSFVLVEEEELVGVDSAVIDSFERSNGKCMLRCDYPTIEAVMKHCHNASVRQRLYHAFNNRAYPKNMSTLENLISKRNELASVLGYKSFAALSLDSKMVKTPERAQQFIADLFEKGARKAKEEFALLRDDLPVGVELIDGVFASYDVGYVFNQYKEKHFNLDARKVSEYFPLEVVIKGMFAIYEDFLNISFKDESSDGSWDDSVRIISVHTKDRIRCLGYLVLDLFPREKKYSHACFCDLIPALRARDDGEKDSIWVGAVVANFPRPISGRPSLLTHSDVTTFFHEFGHAMHSVLGRTTLGGTSGISVKHDFVEVPSQIFEEWMWDKDILKWLSKHYETGDSIPDEYLDAMIALRTFDSGYWTLCQSFFSQLSLDYFSAGTNKDTTRILHDLHRKQFDGLVVPNKQGHMQAAFGHLTGYGAGYYGYLWSRVFAADLFEQIREQGLRDGVTGKRFIDTVLGKGGGQDPDEMLEAFLGRPSTQDAFLRVMALEVN